MVKDTVTMFKEAWVWSDKETKLYAKLCVGKVLHLFSGKSNFGEERIDIESANATRKIDLSLGKLPYENESFDTIIGDPPWAGPTSWDNWIELMHEMTRVSRYRIVLILGNLIFLLPKPFKLIHVYVVKRISPQVKLVYVWEKDQFQTKLSNQIEGMGL